MFLKVTGIIYLLIINIFFSKDLISAEEDWLSFDRSTKIGFFGGSVTQQGKQDGYVTQFRMLYSENQVFQNGYGGLQIYNAGICYIDEALSNRPDVLFLDWSLLPCEDWTRPRDLLPASEEKTPLWETIEESACIILKKCSSAHVVPVFIHMGRKDGVISISRQVISSIIEKYHIASIDMNEIHNEHLFEMFRDDYHTNEIGAKKYAETIRAFLSRESLRFGSFLELLHFESPFYFINSIPIDQEATKKFSFVLNGMLVGIFQTIGPFSGEVTMKMNREGEMVFVEEFKIYDRWCYFERDTIKVCPLKRVQSNGLIEFTLGSSAHDSNRAHRVKIKSLFFTGDLSNFQCE